MVFGSSPPEDDSDAPRTHFGLWLIDVQTGNARVVEAPFFLSKRFRDPESWSRDWRCRGLHGDSVILGLRQNRSYDIGHHLFFFDGDHWTQAWSDTPNSRIITVGHDHKMHRWTEPGLISHPPLMVGGALVRAEHPTRFAVDYTHAFAYDSGPDTPQSPEYLALCEENRVANLGKGYTPCPHELIEAATRVLPHDLLTLSTPVHWPHAMRVSGDHLWVTIHGRAHGGFIHLLQLSLDD